MSTFDAPIHFTSYTPESPALKQLQPMYSRLNKDGTVSFALHPQAHHLNSLGVVHGGILLTLADAALGHSFSRLCGSPVVTVSLNADFIAPASPDAWLEAHVSVDRIGQRLVFGSCQIMSQGTLLLKANAVFAKTKKKKETA